MPMFTAAFVTLPPVEKRADFTADFSQSDWAFARFLETGGIPGEPWAAKKESSDFDYSPKKNKGWFRMVSLHFPKLQIYCS